MLTVRQQHWAEKIKHAEQIRANLEDCDVLMGIMTKPEDCMKQWSRK